MRLVVTLLKDVCHEKSKFYHQMMNSILLYAKVIGILIADGIYV